MLETLGRTRTHRLALAVVVALVSLLPVVAQTPAHARAAALPSKRVWLADVSTAMSGSIRYLDDRVAAAGTGQGLAVVLDIDNTSIATHYAWPDPVLRVRTFARHARALGIKVYFVTGRLRTDVPNVRPVLRRAGYTFTSICGRNQGESLPASKQRCRRSITAAGSTIVANVGNRSTDFAGGNYERAFRLPNYGNQLS
ncbi:HAD family acid phosphatase [Marmoricola sp. RAF53]|uniref:HAD family acid phosphatase n=1 Tax=Marmoricola sp. RAF53 TaxID=3233059 RepID=UPI003F97B59E